MLNRSNHEFEVTTDDEENVFIQDGQLYIKPSLQDATLINNNYTLDMRNSCTATSDIWASCVAITNTNNGSIIPPVKSGRINTIRGASIKYGRVEVTAKMPAGDWLWPAIWMLPVENVYGDWPRSGEIDIIESWGNNASYVSGGSRIMKSSIHWGPVCLACCQTTRHASGANTLILQDSGDDRYWMNVRTQQAKLSSYVRLFPSQTILGLPYLAIPFLLSRSPPLPSHHTHILTFIPSARPIPHLRPRMDAQIPLHLHGLSPPASHLCQLQHALLATRQV